MNFKEWLLITEKIMIKDQEFRDPLLALQYIQKNHPNPENLAITFTAIDKVGINPQSGHHTPLGIYLYPIDYVIKMKMNVPYAGGEPYINVCEFIRPEKILHMTPDVSNQKGMELLNVFPKEQVDKVIEELNTSFSASYQFRSNYSKLWLATQILANNKRTQWNTNLRKCGIDGFVDHGTKTICPEEPTQCVVFTTSALKLLHSIDNTSYPIIDDDGVETLHTNFLKYNSNKMSDEQIIRMLQSRRTLNVENLLQKATNKDKMAKLIIKYKLEIDNNDVNDLFKYTTKKDAIAKLIIDKQPELSKNIVKYLLSVAVDKDKIAELLGTYNISKLYYRDASNLISFAIDQSKIAQIINKYHTKKTPKIQQLIDKYLHEL